MHVISYISDPVMHKNVIQDEILDIVDVAQNRNRENSVTGVLFYANNHFFQTIEGDEANLRQIFRSIEHDPRHRNINILIDEPANERAFSDWSMDTFYIDNPELINPQTLHFLKALYAQNFSINAGGLIEFVKKMVDEMDTFKILQTPYNNL